MSSETDHLPLIRSKFNRPRITGGPGAPPAAAGAAGPPAGPAPDPRRGPGGFSQDYAGQRFDEPMEISKVAIADVGILAKDVVATDAGTVEERAGLL